MFRIYLLLIGYLFGLIQTGYILGKMQKMDIREHGSGNAGTTNALRVMGMKAGLIVFLGDFLKALLPCLFIRYFFGRGEGAETFVYLLYMGLGVILGHNFPIYLKFKGGKGVASTAGVLTALDLRIMLVCLLIFVLIVFATRFVSLASIFVMLAFMGLCYIFSAGGGYGLRGESLTEFRILSVLIGSLSIFRHRANIARLLKGKENKLNFSKNKTQGDKHYE